MSRCAERGYALLMALVVGSLVLAAMALAATALQHRMWLLRQESRAIELSALADAGIARALAELRVDPGYRGGSEELGRGSFEIAVAPIDDEHVSVNVRASCDGGRRAVAAVVRLYDTAPPRVLSWQPVAVTEP